MRKYVNAEAMQHAMKLLQLGAKVQQFNGKMCYVEFEIDGHKLEYAYNINGKNKYFLERIKPYPLPLKVFESEKDVIEIIKIDMEQYKDAMKSKNIDEFIEISTEMNIIQKKFEDLFLYYNISKEKADKVKEHIFKIEKIIDEIQGESKRVNFLKEPDNLKTDI